MMSLDSHFQNFVLDMWIDVATPFQNHNPFKPRFDLCFSSNEIGIHNNE